MDDAFVRQEDPVNRDILYLGDHERALRRLRAECLQGFTGVLPHVGLNGLQTSSSNVFAAHLLLVDAMHVVAIDLHVPQQQGQLLGADAGSRER
jgi:hypothetical protein